MKLLRVVVVVFFVVAITGCVATRVRVREANPLLRRAEQVALEEAMAPRGVVGIPSSVVIEVKGKKKATVLVVGGSKVLRSFDYEGETTVVGFCLWQGEYDLITFIAGGENKEKIFLVEGKSATAKYGGRKYGVVVRVNTDNN